MMCACDKDFAEHFLPHQMKFAVELRSQERIPITLGFHPKACKSCRGLPEDPFPKAQSHGRTSKIHRYYWREIYMETTRRFAELEKEHSNLFHSPNERVAARKNVERQVIEELKSLHARTPKYVYSE